jgi:hypothetical protein
MGGTRTEVQSKQPQVSLVTVKVVNSEFASSQDVPLQQSPQILQYCVYFYAGCASTVYTNRCYRVPEVSNQYYFSFCLVTAINQTPYNIMAQVIGHKRRGISSGETSASSSSTCQLPTLPGGTTPGTLTDELAALFECPVCFEIVLPPIMQCQVGHLVCASCRPKLSCCPTCRGTLGKARISVRSTQILIRMYVLSFLTGNIRNLAMEKVANNLMFPCKHKSTGCRMSLGLNEKAEHEEICEFRPYSCPCPGASCSWQVSPDTR